MKKDIVKTVMFNQYEVVSPDTKLLEKRRKMYQIHEQFEAKKGEFRNQELTFKNGENELKMKDKQLQNKLTSFCQFLQENESKRKKAEERFRQQQKSYSEKQQTIRNLEKEIDELTRSQKKYMKQVQHLRKYEDYLEKVRSTYNDQYPEMTDILTRYQTLRKSNDDRIRERQAMQQLHQTLKRETLIEEKHYNESILTLNNEIKELSRKIEDKLHEKNEVQSELERSNEDYSKKNLNLEKIFMAIDNLHYRCSENSHKLKYEFDEKNLNTDNKKDTKPVKKSEDGPKAEEEVTYEQRSKQAASKLKSILSHMKDFKAIIDQYRLVTKHGKQDKQKY